MRLRRQPPDSSPHTGSLLVALPTLLDPNFRRTILFLTHHEKEEGALGIILNRPAGHALGDLGHHEPVRSGWEDVPVFEGGPVERQNLLLARLSWMESGIRFQSLDAEEDPFTPAARSGKNPSQDTSLELRAFSGYAGWSAGQLEQEIAEKSWHLMPPTPSLIRMMETHNEGTALWRIIMKTLGPWHHLLAGAPDDLSLN